MAAPRRPRAVPGLPGLSPGRDAVAGSGPSAVSPFSPGYRPGRVLAALSGPQPSPALSPCPAGAPPGPAGLAVLVYREHGPLCLLALFIVLFDSMGLSKGRAEVLESGLGNAARQVCCVCVQGMAWEYRRNLMLF